MKDCPGLVRRLARAIQQVAFVAAILLGAVACAGPIKSLYPPRAGETARTVYVINHGALHTGLAVKRSEIPRGVWPENRDYSGFKYLEVGWGDDDGYRKPLTSGIAMKALAGSKRTVLLSDGFSALRAKLDDPRVSIVEVDLSAGGFARLCEHVEQTYALDESGRPIRLGKGWYRARGPIPRSTPATRGSLRLFAKPVARLLPPTASLRVRCSTKRGNSGAPFRRRKRARNRELFPSAAP